MTKFGQGSGIIQTNQGGKLASSDAFRDTMLKTFGYVVEPTGADSPSQNGGAEIYNGTLAVKVRTLLYGSGLPTKFWSVALLHAVYLHNRLVHSATGKTPFEGWHGRKPNVSSLKTFGFRVCIKRSSLWRCKLDRNDFTGIFLGYTATDANIIYLDTDTGIVKSCHHAIFDEAWYLQPTQPPAAQLFYDLRLEADTKSATMADYPCTPPVGSISPITVAWPPLCRDAPDKLWACPLACLFVLLPLRLTETPHVIAAAAARLHKLDNPKSKREIASEVVTQYLIGPHDMEMIYMLLDPYGRTFLMTPHRGAPFLHQ
jgi:hypothetical protein